MKRPAHTQVWATSKATKSHIHFYAAALIMEVVKRKEGKRESEGAASLPLIQFGVSLLNVIIFLLFNQGLLVH